MSDFAPPFLAPRRTLLSCLAIAGFIAADALSNRAQAEPTQRFYIKEYRVDGAKRLKPLEVEEAVYPFLGPGRTAGDVEQARQALEKVYHDKGFQTVSVVVPPQDPRRGIIRLQIAESKVGRLRVKGSDWFLPSRIKEEVPSVAEGTVPNLTRFGYELNAANRMADRGIVPVLRPGVEPGTVDIDLNVEDKSPLHGSLELNNRYSANTSSLRLNGGLSYSNLFQLGHTLGGNFQIAPEDLDDAQVYSGYYLARVAEKTSLMLQGTKQNSDISTLGGAAVSGRGEIIGLHALFDLPITKGFYQTVNLGVDYKQFDEDIVVGSDTISSPIEYYPFSANYSANWLEDNSFTDLNLSLNFHLRGMGSDADDFNDKRIKASGSFLYLRADASHTHDLSNGSQVFGKLQGQASTSPLINSEQIAGGGLGNVRGYLEATALGDNGLFGTFEFRSPSFFGKPTLSTKAENEWRFHAFADVGVVGIYEALPGQDSESWFSSVGIGTRADIRKHYHGSLDVGVPLVEQGETKPGDVRVTFRGWADF